MLVGCKSAQGVQHVSSHDAARFWSHIDVRGEDECWFWRGAALDQYKSFHIQGKNYSATHISHALLVGPVPAGALLAHTCDTPCCVNPRHLFMTDPSGNMQDMLQKGRGNKPRGSRNGAAKLTEDQVRYILTQSVGAKRGWRKKTAAELGVSVDIIRLIVLRLKWKHIPMPEKMAPPSDPAKVEASPPAPQ